MPEPDFRACRRRWVLLDRTLRNGYRRNATSASCWTSQGGAIEVSMELADPPGVSLCFVHCDDGLFHASVVNDAGAWVVLLVSSISEYDQVEELCTNDYFIYRAGPGKPSLDLLPGPLPPSHRAVGTLPLCGAGGQYAVVIPVLQPRSGKYDLHIYRSDTKQRSTKEAPFAPYLATDYDKMLHHQGTSVIPLGRGSIGWIDLGLGLLVVNVLDEKPTVTRLIQWPVPDPEDALEGCYSCRPFRDVALTNHGSMIRFVELKFRDQLCASCNKGKGWIATAWTMTLSSEVWHEGFKVDISKFADSRMLHTAILPEMLDEHGRLTRDKVITGGPTLSLSDDDVVYIMAKLNRDQTVAWVLALNIRHETLQALVQISTR